MGPDLRLLLTVLSLSILCWSAPGLAQSKRVQVYTLSQHYWDVQPGQTLGEIVAALLPAGKEKQTALLHDIVELNPDAFIDRDPNHLLADRRLWLPNTIQTPISDKPATDEGSIEHYSWGSIKRVTP